MLIKLISHKLKNKIYDKTLDHTNYMSFMLLRHEALRPVYLSAAPGFVEITALFFLNMYRDLLIVKLPTKDVFDIIKGCVEELARHTKLYTPENSFHELWGLFCEMMQTKRTLCEGTYKEMGFEPLATLYFGYLFGKDLIHEYHGKSDSFDKEFECVFYEAAEYFKNFYDTEFTGKK